MTTQETQKQGCLTAILNLFRIQKKETFPYKTRDDFLSKTEMVFYRILINITENRVIICPKVGLKELFFISPRDNYIAHFRRISQKHIDFILCDPLTMKPLLGIELDDSSHNQPKRQERDAFIDKVFAAAQLPILHIPARQKYSINELANLIEPHIYPKPTTTPAQIIAPPNTNPSGPPLCPKCNIPMVLRTAARGANQGNQFYGCANYPQCRAAQPYQQSVNSQERKPAP